MKQTTKSSRTGLTGGGPKRTTETFKKFVGGFSGWKKIVDVFFNGCDDWTTQAIFLTEFKTMGRAMECASLKLSNIDLDKYKDQQQIYIHGMKVEKQKIKIDLLDKDGKPLIKNGKTSYTFESIDSTRNFFIPTFEGLNKEFLEIIENTKTLQEMKNKLKKPNELKIDMNLLTDEYGQEYKYHQMYYKVCKIGVPSEGFGGNGWCHRKGEWWQHRIRSERACELVLDYSYDVFKLQAFGGWSSPDMPFEYIGITPAQLMVTKPPKVWA